VITHDAKLWRVDESAVWRWACSCGVTGASTSELGAELRATTHEHRKSRA
jgi:hypothetical protein